MGLPNPYYQDESVTIYHGDCRDILPLLEPNSVDLVLTDPVYSDLSAYELLASNSHKLLVWSGVRYLDCALDAIRKHLSYRGLFAYVNQTTGFLSGKMINKTHFLIWADKNRSSKMYSYLPNGYLSLPWGKDPLAHRWAKNPRFLELAICAFSRTRDMILDPYAGTGITLQCTKKLGRKAIGIEISEKYCEIAVKRLAQGVMDLNIKTSVLETTQLKLL